MSDFRQLLMESLTTELKLCQEETINQEQLETALAISIKEHINLFVQSAVAEYFLIRGDYKKAKFHNKKYRNMLKELL